MQNNEDFYNTTSVTNDFNNIDNDKISLSGDLSKSSSSSAAELERHTINNCYQTSANDNNVEKYKTSINNLREEQNNYDQTCDDAASLTISQTSVDEANKIDNKLNLFSPNNIDAKLEQGNNNSSHNGRESGYGTGGKTKYLLLQPSLHQTNINPQQAQRNTTTHRLNALNHRYVI